MLTRKVFFFSVKCILTGILLASKNVNKSPTLAARISTKGLQFLSNIGHKIVDHEFPKVTFPAISLPIHDGPGSGRVDVSDLHIAKFQSPHFNFHLSPPAGIFFQSKDGAVKIQGKWNASYTWAATVYASGWVELVASDIRSILTLGLYSSNERPQVNVLNCSAKVVQVDVSIGGGVIPWLVNLFRSDLSYALQRTINSQFCLTTQTLISQQLNDLLMTLPTRIPITDNIFFSYSYNVPPKVTNEYIENAAYIDVMLQNETCSLSAAPMKLIGPTIPENFMLSVWMSETLINCFLQSIHQSDLLRLVIDKNTDNGRFAKFLSTSCRFWEVCIGRFFSELREQYPDQHLDFVFHSAEPSIAHFLDRNNGVGVNSKYFVDIHLNPWTAHRTQVLARLSMNASAQVRPQILNARLGGELIKSEIGFTEVFSTFGNFSSRILRTLNLLMHPILEVAINSILRVGLPIPMVENITLDNGTEITTYATGDSVSVVRLDTDLIYANSTKARMSSLNYNFV